MVRDHTKELNWFSRKLNRFKIFISYNLKLEGVVNKIGAFLRINFALNI